MRGQLQCKALFGLQKSRWRKNNEEQWKNNAKNNGNRQKPGRMPTRGCDAGRKATALRSEPLVGGVGS
jgi:hypothetical protein